jgi:hypothetical protein
LGLRQLSLAFKSRRTLLSQLSTPRKQHAIAFGCLRQWLIFQRQSRFLKTSRAHRETGISSTLPERYAAIRKQLIILKASGVKLSDVQLAVIQSAVANLSSMEDHIEKALANKSIFPVAKFNSLISRDIDKLVDVLMTLKTNQEARNGAE